MTREIAYLLLGTAAAAALLLVILLAWHELSGRSSARRYRASVSAARLAMRQEAREQRRQLLADLDRRFGQEPQMSRPGRAGTVVLDLTLDTTKYDEGIQRARDQLHRLHDHQARHIQRFT